MDPTIALVQRIRPVLLNPGEVDAFWAAYTEDFELAARLLRAHPTLTPYTISSWGDENWVHRGIRLVNRMGCLLGTEDLGHRYAELLWKDLID